LIYLFHMWERIKNAVTGTKKSDEKDMVINENNTVIDDDSPVIAELNKNQRRAVLDENKRVLVLAGAGSGKTKTLIQKVMYLIAEKQVSPKNILAITFTRNAANEMMDRLILMADEDGTYQQILSNKKHSFKERNRKRREYIKKYSWLNSITVKTFHGLCNQLLRSRGGSEFDTKYKILMDTVFDADQSSRQIARETTEEIIHKLIILESQRNDASYLLSLKRYILNYYVDVYNLRLHEKQPDLYQKPYTTLGGERVRSKSERDIADWLYRHRIKYVYEPIIAPDTFEMQPDFFIPEANLFLEHVSNLSYSLDDKERVMEEAGENYFKIHESVMNDTALFNKKMDELVLSRIDKDFSHLSPLEFTEEFRGNEKYLRYFILDVMKMIDKIKVHNKQFTTIYDKAIADDHARIRDFYNLAKPLFYGYRDYCVNHSYLDFNDLIIHTVSLLKRQQKIRERYQQKFKYVLVDEFQDVNTLQVELLNQLINDENQLFCVGDDWQSIYGFRGSNVEYIVNFKEYFSNPTIIKLHVNYRSNTTIVNASNEIIKHNKYKIDKEIQSYQEHGKKIYLYSARNEEMDGVATVLKNCEKLLKNGYKPEDILVLTRTRKSDAFKEYYEQLRKKRIRITTIHQAKGLEAKIVFIIGLVDGYYGFPNLRDDDRIFQLIKKSDFELNMEEERRLFYVALTRAKEELFLISELGRESDFITEIPGQFLDRKNFLILNIKKQQEKKICSNCHKIINLSDEIRYCPYCGNKISSMIQKDETKLNIDKKNLIPTSMIKNDSIKQTYDLFLNNKSPAEIAKKRGFTLDTIYSHLTYLIKNNFISASHLISEEKKKLILPVIKRNKDGSLKTMKSNLPEDITYNEIRIVLASLNQSTHRSRSDYKTDKKQSKQEIENNLSDTDKKILNELKKWRYKTAKSLSIPAFCILHDRILYDIIERKPQCEKELKEINGIGKQKIEKYGSDIIRIINAE
jgi:DNA helicase IV